MRAFFKGIGISLLLSVCVPVADAHQDRVIKLEGDRLVGLPDQYAPAEFSIGKRTVCIGGNKVRIPDCLWTLWANPEPEAFRISASWYHDPDHSPPYLIFGAPSADGTIAYRVTLDLDSLQLLAVWRDTCEGGALVLIEKLPVEQAWLDAWLVEPAVSLQMPSE